ncbi:hypothetical protein [Buttiauxella gaviniae]|jgi:hypothetical protein|uniref:hypothetical protein n=1 Tax=Buttiauxella gaviniae TaxID=82990 RepID=UPI003C76A340
MHKKLFLLEWKLCQTRAWAGWLLLWILVSFLMLSAMMLTGYLLESTVLPPGWLAIWCVPLLACTFKVRVVELNNVLKHTIHLGGIHLFHWHTCVKPGLWSVDRINGRYRLNRITLQGDTVHYPWRLQYMPVFLEPLSVSGDMECLA